MDLNKFGIGLVGFLEKLKTERQVKFDIKTLKEINIPLVGKLLKTRTKAQLKKDIESVTATVDLTAKASKKGLSASIKDIVKQAQEVANKDNIKLNIGGIDNKKLDDIIAKLKQLSQSNNTLDTAESVNAINREAQAMLEIIDNARKAALEKLEFAEANREVRESAERTADVVVRERNAMESLDNINYILANINMNVEQGDSVFRRFGNTLNEAFATYTIANLLEDAIYEIIDASKEGIEVVKELNDVATSLRMATGSSLEETNALVDSYNDLGQELGSITRDVSESADAWLRQGHTIADTNTLITDSMMLSKIANLESAESTEYLTSIMQAYRLSVEEVVDIVSKLSAVDLESASDAGGLAKAMSRCASAAKMAGVSMDTLIGYIATVKEVTQDSDEAVGNMFKSVFSRMNQIRAGKFVDLETGESLNDTEKVLNKIGIVTRDLNNQLINSEQILDSIGKSWETYDSNTQKALATAVAGTYQYNKFIALMQSYADAMNYANISAGSKGVAEEKFGYYLDSLESKTNSLQASLENLATTTLSDELYGSVLDTSKAIVDLIADTGVLKGLLIGLGTSASIYGFQQITNSLGDITQGFANLNEAMNMTRGGAVGINDMQRLIDLTGGLSQSQTRLLLSTNNLTDAQKIAILMNQGLTQAEAQQTIQTWGVASAQNGATAATITFTGALRGLWTTLMANPLILVTTLISAGVMAYDAYNKKLEETKQRFDDLKTEVSEIESELSSLNTELQTTVERMNELEGKDTLTFTEKEEYDNLVKQNNELQRRINLLELEQEVKNKEKNKAFVNAMNSDTSNENEYWRDENTGRIHEGNSFWASLGGTLATDSTEEEYINQKFEDRARLLEEKRNAETKEEQDRIQGQIDDIDSYLQSKSSQWTNDASGISYIYNPTTEDDKAVNAWLDYIADFQDRMAIAMGGTNAKGNAFNRLVDNWQFDETMQGLQDLGEQGQVTADMLDDPKYDEFIQKLVEIGVVETAEDLDGIALAFNKVAESADSASGSTSNFVDEAEQLSKLNENINTAFDSIQKSYDALQEFKEAMSNGMTESALDGVSGLSDELKAMVAEFYAGTVSADELFQSLTEHYNTDLENYGKVIIAKNELNEEFYNNIGLADTDFVNGMKTNYGIDISNCKNYAEAKLKIEQELSKKCGELWTKYYNAQLGTMTLEYESLKKRYEYLQDPKIMGNAPKYYVDQVYSEWQAVQDMMNGYQSAIDALNKVVYDGLDATFDGVSGSFSTSSSKETIETFNWIKVAVERVQRTISNLGDIVGSTYKKWSTRNNALAQEIYAINDEITLQQKAYNKYMSLANSVVLSSYYKSLVQNGAIQIDSIKSDSLKEQIKQYQELYEQALECQDAIAELRGELVNLAETKFDNYVAEYENQLSMIEQQANMINQSMDNMESKGYMVSAVYYDALIDAEQTTLTKLHEKYNALNSTLSESVKNGTIEQYSEKWCEMQLEIDGVKEAILESEGAVIEFNNALRDLDWDVFDKMQNSMSKIPTESDFLIDLMSDEDMHDDEGNLTNHGQATLGLHAINYNVYMAQADEYAKELLELNKEIADDPNNQTLLERREELLNSQRSMIKSTEDELQSIKDLYSNGYDKLLDSMSKIIDKRKSMLSQIKDAYSYQKSIEEQTVEVSKYQKIIDSLQGMKDTEQGKSLLQKYEVSLREARDNLESTQYEQYMQDQSALLDSLFDQTSEWINTRLDDLNGIVQSAIDSTNANAETIKATLETETDEVGIKLSDEMSKILASNDGMKAVVTMYGADFCTQITTVNSTLLAIKSVIEGMVNASDTTASKEVSSSVNTSNSSSASTVSTPTTHTSVATTTNSVSPSSSKDGWKNALVYSEYVGNNSKLNTSTSIVDLLKSHDYSSEFSDRANLYKAINGSGVYTGSSSQNRFLIDFLKSKGFAKGGTIGSLIKSTGEDGFVLARTGEEILSLDKIKELGFTFEKMKPIVDTMKNLPNLTNNTSNVTNAPNITVDMSGMQVVANDPDQFAKQVAHSMQNYKFVKQIMNDETLGNALGRNTLMSRTRR